MTGPASFVFLNQEKMLIGPGDWNQRSWSRLWRYHLHYFDDLNASGATERSRWHNDLLRRWIDENPVGLGAGWEPYPISLRVVNWVKWLLNNGSLRPEFSHSLAVQCRVLVTRLEYHLLGNHLWANAKALVFAGCYFDGKEAAAWRSKGLQILGAELDEQILDDGGHFERSPMYHAIVLEDVLDLIQLDQCYKGLMDASLGEILQHKCMKMFVWLSGMTHPDGDLAFFNDCALGQAPTLSELIAYATALGVFLPYRSEPVFHLERSGYVSARYGVACLIADVGEVGPAYQPGHAHAETLSFEFSLGGNRVFVNSGIDRYEEGPERLWQRGTAAHNTVQVDGEDSSQVWKSFRVARRAHPFGLALKHLNDALAVHCSHDGYKRLPGRVLHHRDWVLSETGLTLTDQLEGVFRSAVSRLYLHPSVELVSAETTSARLRIGKFVVELQCKGATLSVQTSQYFARLGEARSSSCLHLAFQSPRCDVNIAWLATVE